MQTHFIVLSRSGYLYVLVSLPPWAVKRCCLSLCRIWGSFSLRPFEHCRWKECSCNCHAHCRLLPPQKHPQGNHAWHLWSKEHRRIRQWRILVHSRFDLRDRRRPHAPSLKVFCLARLRTLRQPWHTVQGAICGLLKLSWWGEMQIPCLLNLLGENGD